MFLYVFRFLAKSLVELKKSYCNFMPLYPIVDFITDYTKLLDVKGKSDRNIHTAVAAEQEKIFNETIKSVSENVGENGIKDKITVFI